MNAKIKYNKWSGQPAAFVQLLIDTATCSMRVHVPKGSTLENGVSPRFSSECQAPRTSSTNIYLRSSTGCWDGLGGYIMPTCSRGVHGPAYNTLVCCIHTSQHVSKAAWLNKQTHQIKKQLCQATEHLLFSQAAVI